MAVVPSAFVAVTVNEPGKPAVVGDGKPVTAMIGAFGSTGFSRYEPDGVLLLPGAATSRICPLLLIFRYFA